MRTFEKQNFTGKSIKMDGNKFVRCTFTKCNLIFSGGDTSWQETQFIECKLGFGGAASRTLQYLACFGHQFGQENVTTEAVATGGTEILHPN